MLVNLFVHDLMKIYIYYVKGTDTQWHVGIVTAPPPPVKYKKRGKVNIIGQLI